MKGILGVGPKVKSKSEIEIATVLLLGLRANTKLRKEVVALLLVGPKAKANMQRSFYSNSSRFEFSLDRIRLDLFPFLAPRSKLINASYYQKTIGQEPTVPIYNLKRI